MTDLTDRYRRMLRWYPRDHRTDHEEEMLGVLLAGARPGQTRPTLCEAGDLVLGGLRVRASRAVAAEDGAGWRDAFAVVGVLVPLIMSSNAVRLAIEWLTFRWVDFAFTRAHPDWSAWAIWPLVAILALVGARRIATVTAITAIVWWTVVVGYEYLRFGATAAVVAIWWPLFGLVAAASLAVRSEPGQVLRALRRHKTLLAAMAVLLATVAIAELMPYVTSDLNVLASRDTVGRYAAVVAGVLALCSPVGRRMLVLLSAPMAAFLILDQARGIGGGPWSNLSVTGLLVVVPLSFAVFAIGALFLGPIERVLRLARYGNG